jgi:hypothetical protein
MRRQVREAVRPLVAFFLIELGSRRIMPAGVTRAPSSA